MIRREPFGGVIFDERTYKIYKLNKISFRALELYAEGYSIKDIYNIIKGEFELDINIRELEEFIEFVKQKFETKNFIQRGDTSKHIWKKNWKGAYLSAPILVYWTFTNLCNLGCTHCAWNSGKPLPNELSLTECKKVIDELAELGVGYISFSGGEPLTKKKMLFEMASYAKDYGIPLGLATNATLIDDKTADKIKEIGFVDVQISMEGLEAHEVIRGKGIFEKTVAGTKKLIERNIPCTFAVAINKTNLKEIDNIIKLAKSLNIKNIRFVRFIPIGRGKQNYSMFELSPAEEVKLALTLWDKRWKELPNGLNITFNKHYVSIGALYNPEKGKVASHDLWDWDCPAARVRICIMPDGSVSPCPLLGSLGLSCGDLRKDSIKDLWENSELFNYIRREKKDENSQCANCKFWELCKGGCKASSYAYYNELMAPDRLCFGYGYLGGKKNE